MVAVGLRQATKGRFRVVVVVLHLWGQSALAAMDLKMAYLSPIGLLVQVPRVGWYWPEQPAQAETVWLLEGEFLLVRMFR